MLRSYLQDIRWLSRETSQLPNSPSACFQEMQSLCQRQWKILTGIQAITNSNFYFEMIHKSLETFPFPQTSLDLFNLLLRWRRLARSSCQLGFVKPASLCTFKKEQDGSWAYRALVAQLSRAWAQAGQPGGPTTQPGQSVLCSWVFWDCQ